MTEIEAIKERHSVRNYRDKKIEPEKVLLLEQKIAELNANGHLHLQFIVDAGKTYRKLPARVMGLSSAPIVIACVGPDIAELENRVGYYGEQLVLYAQTLGLNTCWTGMFNRSQIPAKVEEGERLAIAIAIGYGEHSGQQHKSKSVDKVSSGEDDRPYWFHYGVEMALLAPTAMNQQKFEIIYDNGDVIFRDKGGLFSKVDLGIVRYHFEVGAAAVRQQKKKEKD